MIMIYPLVTNRVLTDRNGIGGFAGNVYVNGKNAETTQVRLQFMYGLLQYYYNMSNEPKHRRPDNVIIISRRVTVYRNLPTIYNIVRLRRVCVCVQETKDFPCSSRVHRLRCTFDWPAPIYYYTRSAHPVPSPSATPL